MTIKVDERNIYLHDVALSEALASWHAALDAAGLLDTLPGETIALDQALGRVTAEPVWARISSPHYHAAAMDGYAVRAEETRGATETSPRLLKIGSRAHPVDTGDPLPPDTNAVIKIEDTHIVTQDGVEHIEILASTPPWRYVRPMGEDMVATELVLPANHRIRPQDIGAIAGCGHTQVTVYRRPRVAIIPTGTELVKPGESLKPGAIIEYNSLVLGALAEEAGAVVTRLPIEIDVRAAIKATVEQALATHDLVVVNAGSSAGSEDFTASIVAELGTLCVHGIAMRPGHPVILGVANGKAIAGIPGFPVSAAMTFDIIVRPLLYRWQGQLPPDLPKLDAVLTRKVLSPMGEDEFMRVALGRVGDRIVATPLSSGSGVIMSLVKADGIVTIPRFSEGHHAGETVTVDLLRSPRIIDNTIVAIGSHDMTLDLLADLLQRKHPTLRLSSSHVGSVSGLLALQRNEAHLAGSHLLDEESGEYNTGYIQRMLVDHGVHVVLLGFVNRTQGLIVPKGNPKGLGALDDLLRDDVVFVNRQRGAGTRVLLDYELKKRAINARQIQGYERTEYTHLSVAAAVKSGAADTGLGILAAARALDLDFVPLFDERYDLVIPVAYYESDLLKPLLALIDDRSSGFAAAVEALGGYGTEQMGRVLGEV
ncbi:MAG: molybdopterin biosynthesis protein [Caldilinea sp.]|nr:molybdopterin biosynthesis protein [Caldilineaceae bacterium]MCB9119050.1 molybdopterin biosynthesis protein [Caldilineaceae bacterium]MCB9125475.1 molybdopterin biosynthesis protein [Caldilineaceae bacterium]MCO5213271.1 molybdopterin biosynthesis protein [Caldilinea sp.]MCW5844825.1 molybdopterin biosynthesis protein [Caldilinea sp.]